MIEFFTCRFSLPSKYDYVRIIFGCLRQWQSCCRRCPHGHPSRHTSSMPGELPLNPDIQLSPKSVTKALTADFPEVPSLGSRAKGGRMETPPPATIAIVWEAKLSYRFPSFPAHIDHQRLHAKHTQTCFASFSTQNNARIIDAKTSITGQSPSLYHRTTTCPRITNLRPIQHCRNFFS